MNAPNTLERKPMPDLVTGFTKVELMLFVKQQVFTLGHYAGIAKDCGEQEATTALVMIGDTLFDLYQLMDRAESEGSAES
jgi:hypothetical protein